MPDIHSKKATFTDLSVRTFQLGGYSSQEKFELFEAAAKSIKKLLEDNSQDKNITSIPELMRMVFDTQNQNPELENIREALRPSHQFGRHTMSATGNKLLACLAMVQNESCIGHDGKLDLKLTKNIIRSWFDNPGEVDFDESALRNIHSELDNHSIITLGKNRLTEKKVHFTGVIRNAISINSQQAGLGTHSIQIDFDKIPSSKSISANYNEVALGDMNGNSMRLLHELVHTGIVQIQSGMEAKWAELMHSIEQNQVQPDFGANLDKVIKVTNPEKRLVLLGDLLCDRAHNDWFMLSVIDFLDRQGQQLDIIFSNHDCGFLEYYLLNKDKSDTEAYSSTGSQNKRINKDATTSLQALESSLNTDPMLRPQFLAMTETYKKHLLLLSPSLDQQALYSHAVVNEAMFEDMLKLAGQNLDDRDTLSINEQCTIINKYVREKTFINLKEFQSVWCKENMIIQRDSNSAQKKQVMNPFYQCIWNVGPIESNSIFADPNDRYCNMDVPAGMPKSVHGHTSAVKEIYETRENMIKLLDTRVAQLRSNALKDPLDYIRNSWRFLRDAERLNTDDAISADALYVQLENIRAFAGIVPGINKALDDFDEALAELPGGLNDWFHAYKTEDLNDPVMKIKIAIKLAAVDKTPVHKLLEKQPPESLKLVRTIFFDLKEAKTSELAQKLETIFKLSIPNAADNDVLAQHFPRHTGLLRILDRLAEKISNPNEHVKTLKKPESNMGANGMTRTTPDALDLYMAEQMERVSKGKKNHPISSVQVLQMDKMDHYISLDNPFGGEKSHRRGEVSVFVA